MCNLKFRIGIAPSITLRKNMPNTEEIFVYYMYVGDGVWVKVWHIVEKPMLVVLREDALHQDIGILLHHGYGIHYVADNYISYVGLE